MLEKNILDKIAAFFKSLGTKKASGEPIDLGRPKHDFETEEKEVKIMRDAPMRLKATTSKVSERKPAKEESEPAVVSREKTVRKGPTIVAKVTPKKVYSADVEALRNQYSWRKLKVEKALPVAPLPEPFYFLTSDNQPVEASKFEISFVKELLSKAAEAGIENKFTFSLSSTMSVVVKYKGKLVGRVYLHGRKHRMTFKSAGKTITEDNLTLSECKKLITVWLGQIKQPA